MANSKTTTKSNTKSSNSKSKVTMKTVPNVRNFKPEKVYDKKVTKKDGKVTVTYQKLNQSGIIDRPSKVRKIYDNKGNLIKGNERVSGGYGSYTDIGIKGKKKTAPVTKSSKAKVSYNPDFENKKFVAKKDMMVPEKKTGTTGKNVRSKQDAAKIKGIVDGLQRPSQKKTTTKPKPVAPKMATTIGSAKVSVPSKGKVKIEPNLGKPKSFTPPKTETKAKVQTAPKPASRPEPIKMELIPLKQVAQDLQDSRPKADLAPIKTPVAKTSTPVEENTGILARMKQRREDRKQGREYRKEARQAEKDAEKAETAKMKKGGMVKPKMQNGGAASKFGIKSYNFMDTEKGGRADSSSKQVEGAKYGEGNKRKYITLDADKGTMTKTKFNKNNESSTKVKNIGTKRVTNKISRITSQKNGGIIKTKKR